MNYALVAKVFDELKSEGIIGDWAIAGGSAALFYVEPFVTFDVDLFVSIAFEGALVNLERFHTRVREMGFELKGEHIDLAGMPIQIMLPNPGLEAEALSEAVVKRSADQEIRVISAEHVMAICLKTGRAKDKLRLEMFLDEKAFNVARLEQILSRHSMSEQWQQYLKSRP